jgi:hypothetical protein
MQHHTGSPGQHAIDPAIAGSQNYSPMTSPGPTADGQANTEGRRGRRELSTSKRAAQNRAAQVRLIIAIDPSAC